MRHYLRLMLFILLPAFAYAKQSVVLYVCAHPDDCALFMNPNLYDDTVDASKRVVVVYLTSGDAGMPYTSEEEGGVSYPVARELASIESMQWMADVGKSPITAKQENETVTIHGHEVTRLGYANTASYFLRLPDGNFEGNGFERYDYQSLRKLKTGEISGITPIDGQSAYADWNDFLAVVSGIITRETEGENAVTLHIAEPDMQLNTNDHSDHTIGASGVMEALALRSEEEKGTDRCYQVYKHIDYSIADKTPNLEGVALQNKSGSFAVLTATQRRFLDHHHWDKAHLSYITRNYYTTISLPAGCDALE